MNTQTAEKTQTADAPKTQQAVATRPVRSVLIDMSEKYGMEPGAFEEVVRATCMQPDKKGRVPNRAEFAAFLLVAKAHDLNPLLREIFAFTSQAGGIVPIVSVDGWVNLINSHPALDGIEFDEHHDGEALKSTTCRIYRKDRSKPIVVTEYLSECIRDTGPWKMRHRMLRHKALIQCSRYAFGFAGIYDEDEGRAIIDAQDKEPVRQPPRPNVPVEVEDLGHRDEPKDGKIDRGSVDDIGFGSSPTQGAATEHVDKETGEVTEEPAPEQEREEVTPGEMLEAFDTEAQTAKTEMEVQEIWLKHDLLARLQSAPKGEEFLGVVRGVKEGHLRRVRKG